MLPDQSGIYITKRQASLSVAAIVVLGLLIFIAGYFWGKSTVLDEYSQKTSQESLNDQVDYLMAMQSFAEKQKPESESEPVSTSEESQIALQQDESSVVPEEITLHKPTKASKKKGHYQAALIGFGKKSNAVAFVQRLSNHGIPVHMKARKSKSASGKAVRVWYQILTNSYDTEDELQDIIARVQQVERIKTSDIKLL